MDSLVGLVKSAIKCSPLNMSIFTLDASIFSHGTGAVNMFPTTLPGSFKNN